MRRDDRDPTAGTEPPAGEGLDLPDLGDIPDPAEAHAGEIASAPVAPSPAAWGSSPTRGEARRRRWIAAGLAGAWLIGALLILGFRVDLGHGSLRTFVQIVLPALGGAAVIATALASGRGGLGSRTGRLVAAFAIAALLFPVGALFGSGALLDDRPGIVRGIAVCFALVLVLGGIPLAALGYGLRRAFPANARWRSVLVAAGAGLFGAAALGSHCSTHCGLHMTLGHALPAIVLAFGGGVLLSRLTRA